MDEKGPLFFSSVLDLVPYLVSPNSKFTDSARKLVVVCYTTLPHFGNWTHFVRPTSEQKESVTKIVEGALSPFKHTDSPLNRFELRERRKTIQSKSDYFFQDFVEGKASEPTPAPVETDVAPTAYAESLRKRLDQHGEEKEKDILDNTESEILAKMQAIRDDNLTALLGDDDDDTASIASSRMGTMTAKESALMSKKFRDSLNEIEKLRNKLIAVHRERRAKNRLRFDHRSEYLKERKENDELAKVFHQHLGLQNRAIKILTGLYELLETGSQHTDVIDELCTVDRLLNSVYDVSVSIVVGGLISVGKSTFVNCLVGQGIAPDRSDTMTAIPIRYLNDATVKVPRMLVPFHLELNRTCETIRRIIASSSLEAVKDSLLKVHLLNLVDLINGGLVFRERYEGIEEIRDVSTLIHDLFRLAVDPSLPEDLSANLPLSWCRGLDTYLTVVYGFPGLDAASGLVTLSVVDTPGIDEDGVQKLRFHDVITDAISVSNFSVMITSPDRYQAIAMEALRALFFDAGTHRKNNASMLVVTHTDLMGLSDRPAFISNVTATMTHKDDDGVDHAIFRDSDVFLVSASKKLLSSRMISFLAEHNRKPEETDSDPAASRLAADFILFAKFGNDTDEKRDAYAEDTIESLQKICKRLAESSHMADPLGRLKDASLKYAVPLCVSSNLQKAEDVILSLLERLDVHGEEVSPQSVEEAKAQLKTSKKAIKKQKKLLHQAIDTKIREITNKLATERTVLDETLPVVLERGVDEMGNLQHLSGHIAFHIRATKNPKALALMTSKGDIEFDNEDDLALAYTVVLHAIKVAVADRLMKTFKTIPEDAKKFAKEQRQGLQKEMKKTSQLYQETFKIKTSKKKMDFQLAAEEEEVKMPNVSFNVVTRLKAPVEEVKKKGWFKSGVSKIKHKIDGKKDDKKAPVEDPKDRVVVAKALELRLGLKLDVIKMVDDLFNDLVRQVEKITAELKALERSAKESLAALLMIIETRMLETTPKPTEDVSGPRKALVSDLNQKLEEVSLAQRTA